MTKRFYFITLILFLLIPSSLVQAQTATPPSGPVYIIQPGDNLSGIASSFGVTLTDLLAANNITDPNNISAGMQLIIPGLQGIIGILTTEIFNYGDTLKSLSRRDQVDEAFLRKLNHITSPSELYAGTSLILPQEKSFTPLSHRFVISTGEGLLEAAITEDSDPWTLSQINRLRGSWDGLPGDILYNPNGKTEESSGSSGLPSAFEKVNVPLPMTQGGSEVINVQLATGAIPSGTLVNMPLHFFKTGENTFTTLQGVYVMLTPGPYPLRLEAELPDGTKQSFEQMIIVKDGGFPFDPMLEVDPTTIDPAVTGPENQQMADLTAPITPDKLWQGKFQLPVDPEYCLKSRFGDRRAYNGGDYTNFHGGLDFGVCSALHPFDIYAPSDGIVVYTGKLVVRGNVTILNHGWGIYTCYFHQSEIDVKVGDQVKAGQLIGKIGDTGRVTGPHLHWEIWVNGIQVNPLDWLNNTYP